mmetsp:Transcript_105377/g.198431  ORF Transcript_105377/g.198431 Transcript_105377/m.198431 type:complete len:315 (+) Transcript_105377:534-1478(+)
MTLQNGFHIWLNCVSGHPLQWLLRLSLSQQNARWQIGTAARRQSVRLTSCPGGRAAPPALSLPLAAGGSCHPGQCQLPSAVQTGFLPVPPSGDPAASLMSAGSRARGDPDPCPPSKIPCAQPTSDDCCQGGLQAIGAHAPAAARNRSTTVWLTAPPSGDPPGALRSQSVRWQLLAPPIGDFQNHPCRALQMLSPLLPPPFARRRTSTPAAARHEPDLPAPADSLYNVHQPLKSLMKFPRRPAKAWPGSLPRRALLPAHGQHYRGAPPTRLPLSVPRRSNLGQLGSLSHLPGTRSTCGARGWVYQPRSWPLAFHH